jgi:CRP-like cAMP-binding protein
VYVPTLFCDMHHIIYICSMKNDCKNCPFNSKATLTLNECSFEQLNANHAIVDFGKGDKIIQQGNLSTNVAFLRIGLAKVHITGPYHEQIVKLVKAPTYLGIPTTFGDKINQYSVTAVSSDVEVCFIDVDIFRNLLKENEQFSYEIILELCRNELESFRRCANRTQKQTRGNMADVLLDFSDNIFQSDTFMLPLNQSEMGNMVDTSRESISRILSEFDKDGIIQITGKQIEILDKSRLQLISQNG